MRAPILGRWWSGWGGNVGRVRRVTVVPGISLIHEVIQTGEYEDRDESSNALSADC